VTAQAITFIAQYHVTVTSNSLVRKIAFWYASACVLSAMPIAVAMSLWGIFLLVTAIFAQVDLKESAQVNQAQ
jgi:hypothetical protein